MIYVDFQSLKWQSIIPYSSRSKLSIIPSKECSMKRGKWEMGNERDRERENLCSKDLDKHCFSQVLKDIINTDKLGWLYIYIFDIMWLKWHFTSVFFLPKVIAAYQINLNKRGFYLIPGQCSSNKSRSSKIKKHLGDFHSKENSKKK